MTNYVKRLVYVDAQERQRINPLVWPFFFATFVYGFGFMFGGQWSGVTASSLWQAFYALHSFLPAVWGACALLAASLALALILTRKYVHLGDFAAMFGVLVWLFAGFTYALNGYWLVVLTVAGPNLFFWVFYYWRLAWYKRAKKAGVLVDAG